MNHTSGPWHILQSPQTGELWVVTQPETQPFVGQVIASRTTCPDWPANARLIAASPSLLAACRAMVANVDRWLESGVPATDEESRALYEQMTDAIAEATGETA